MSRIPNSESAATSAPGAIAHAQDHRCAVGAGTGRWRRGPTDEHEPRAGIRFVDDTFGECRKTVVLRGQRRADPRVGPPGEPSWAAAALEMVGTTSAAGQMPGQPPPDLRRGHRERGHRTDVRRRGTRRHHDAECDVQGEFGEDPQR